MSKLFLVVDTEATGPDFSRHNMYQFGYVPVMEDGTLLPGESFDLLFDTEHHDQDTLDFLARELALTARQSPKQSIGQACKGSHGRVRQ